MREIPFGRPMIGAEERSAVASVLAGPILVHGPKTRDFEAAFAEWAGGGYGVSVASCTAGLHLAYFHLGVGPGDEVIVPAQTHAATAHAVEFTGAKPVFVDANPSTGNIDIEAIEESISARTKVICVVHYLGLPVDMDRVNAIARRHGLFVLEDAALAVGTRYKGVHAGLLGDAGVFSFYPVKHMTTAEGGMFLTRHEEIAAAVARKRAFGVDRTVDERKIPGVYDVTLLGFNYRMNEIEAALGIEQLKRMEGFLARRETNFSTLSTALADVDEVGVLETAGNGKDLQSSYYCLAAVLHNSLAAKRDEIVRALNSRGVGTSVYYPRPVPHMTYYRDKYGFGERSFPNAAKISYGSIALPVGPHLSPDDMTYIAENLKDAIARMTP